MSVARVTSGQTPELYGSVATELDREGGRIRGGRGGGRSGSTVKVGGKGGRGPVIVKYLRGGELKG